MNRALSLSTLSLGLALLAGCSIGDAQSRLRSAVDAKGEEFNDCYAQALTRDQSIQGSLDAVLYVDKVTGAISRVEFANGAVGDGELERCMTSVLGTVQVDGDLKKNLEVSYTFELRQSR